MFDTIRFTAIRAVKMLFKQSLEIVDEIRVENDFKIAGLTKTLEELEDFLKDTYDIDVNLVSYVKYTNVLDESKVKQLRKRILDNGNSLLREIEDQR